MNLTSAQYVTLKADLAANVNTVLIAGVPTAINVVEQTPDNAFAVAAWYNQATSPVWTVWQTAAPIGGVYDTILWEKLTPTDAVPTDTTLNVEIWQARSLACQGKQFNIQTMLQGKTTVNGSLSNFRAGLKDALTSIPSGTNGASVGGGWNSVQAALQRTSNNVEKLFSTGAGTADQNAATLVVEGALTFNNVVTAWNS